MSIQVTNTFQNVPQKQPFYQTCSICCQQKLRGYDSCDYYRLPDICYQCWYSHVKSYITRISYRAGDSILSPFSQGQPLDIVKCINSMKKNDAIEIQQIVYKKYTAFTKDIEKCPSQNCDFVYIGDKCKWNSKQNVYNCPKCEMPLIQQKAYTMKSLMASFYLMMANKCPKCDIPIEKISGCPHMTCPCGHHFCWYCYKDHPSGTLKRVYHLHTIPQCAFIFISKIVLFLICCISLLVTFNGNWVIRYIFGIAKSVFWVVARAAVMDGFILAQIMFFMMRKRRRAYRPPQNKFKQIIGAVLVNLLGLFILYWFDQITSFVEILAWQLGLAFFGFLIGYSVIYSIETWFQFIA